MAANQALEDLINRVRENKGAVPSVNPPTVAVRVLEQETRPEVNQTSTSSSADSDAAPTAPAAEQAGASTPGAAESAASDAPAAGAKRRTAAVVQAELDLALKELATAGEQIAALKRAPSSSPTRSLAEHPLEDIVAELKRRGLGIFSLGGGLP